jgi:hypothetical protein
VTAAYLAPYSRQQFFAPNGQFLSYGSVFTYEAGSTTPIATFTDSTGITQNTNPIDLDAYGSCSIWLNANTAYKFDVLDQSGNRLPGYPVDQIIIPALLTLYGGIDTGVSNAYILNFTTPEAPTANGQVIFWVPSNSNTGPSTLNVNGGGPEPILNPNGTPLGANQLIAGQFASVIQLNGIWQLYGGSGVGVNIGTFGAEVPLPSAATTDLGSVPGHNAQITGSATITSFGTSAQLVAPIYIVRISGTPLLTASSALILPGNTNIQTASGDSFLAEYMGSGNWRVLIYQYASGSAGNSVVKPADTSRVSTTTLAADPDLQTGTLAVGKYSYELFLLFDSVAAGAGFKFTADGTFTDSRATSPAVASGQVNALAYGPKLESFVSNTIAYATVSTTTDSNGVLYKGSLLVNTAGTFGISWAQNSSTASNTTLRAGSYLTVDLLATGGTAPGIIHTYTTPGSGTETIPAGYTNVLIEVWAASGAGGAHFGSGCITAGGGGAGSGGYSQSTYVVTGAGGQTIDYFIGAAGTVAAPNGSAGGNSTLSSGTFAVTAITAVGGSGGTAATSLTVPGTGGAAGSATGGNVLNLSGNAGANGQTNSGGGNGGAGGAGIPGINDGGAAGGRGGGVMFSGRTGGGNGIVVFSYTP